MWIFVGSFPWGDSGPRLLPHVALLSARPQGPLLPEADRKIGDEESMPVFIHLLTEEMCHLCSHSIGKSWSDGPILMLEAEKSGSWLDNHFPGTMLHIEWEA